MQTADWALVISICSAAVSLAGFVWNVWSKFIYPKPAVRVSFQMMRVVQPGHSVDEQILTLIATNMGPAQVTLRTALIAYPTTFPWQKYRRFSVLNPLHNYPVTPDRSIGPFGGGLPKKLEIGEQFSVYLIPDHESLARGDYQRIGFDDTFGSLHWAPRRHILDALPAIRAACEAAGKNGELNSERTRRAAAAQSFACCCREALGQNEAGGWKMDKLIEYGMWPLAAVIVAIVALAQGARNDLRKLVRG